MEIEPLMAQIKTKRQGCIILMLFIGLLKSTLEFNLGVRPHKLKQFQDLETDMSYIVIINSRRR